LAFLLLAFCPSTFFTVGVFYFDVLLVNRAERLRRRIGRRGRRIKSQKGGLGGREGGLGGK
jgi:hypothetical protein